MTPLTLLLMAIVCPIWMTWSSTEMARKPTHTVTTAIGSPYMAYEEGEPFWGSPDFCRHEAARNNSRGFTFEPDALSRVADFKTVWKTGSGRCRLLTSAPNVSTYIFRFGERWGFELTYIHRDDRPVCLSHRYVGLEKTMNTKGQPLYSIPAPENSTDFCLALGSMENSCQTMWLKIIGFNTLEFYNKSVAPSTPLYCSLRESACHASIPIYETPAGKSVLAGYYYTVKPVGGDSKILCYGWPRSYC